MPQQVPRNTSPSPFQAAPQRADSADHGTCVQPPLANSRHHDL